MAGLDARAEIPNVKVVKPGYWSDPRIDRGFP